MIELPNCPRCGMKLEAFRFTDGKVDTYWNPVYTIYCGCPDCRNFVTLNCVVSETFIGDGTVSPTKRQEFWDSQYEYALDNWKKRYQTLGDDER